MISDITLGQYFPGNSALHKADPRTKILLATLYIVTLFLASRVITLAAFCLLTLLLIPVSGISAKTLFRAVKPIFFILLFTAVINLLVTKGEGEPLVAFWIIKIYEEGVIRAVMMAVRVMALVIGTSILLTYTTTPISLTDGLESLLKPLALIHIPVHIFSMMITIALRFIPTLVRECERIMNAQKSRGADFSTGSLFKRAKALIPLLVPLFVSSFKRAEELATAMECRCYRVDKPRTKMHKLQFAFRDFLLLAVGCALLALVILDRTAAPDFNLPEGTLRDILLWNL